MSRSKHFFTSRYNAFIFQPLYLALLFFMGSTLGFTANTSPQFGYRGNGACTTAAKAVHRACRHDAKEEFWISFGNCFNSYDFGESLSCAFEAYQESNEEKQACREQKSARFEICDLLGDTPYLPDISPENFMTREQIATNPNPYFPLIPGMIKVFQAGDETITVTVLDDEVEILGVPCVAVRDTVEEDDELVEDTIDWYAQDTQGNVWYFGEISKNYEDGELTDLDGSWKSGVDGAQPGILMFAQPVVGTVYRQEYLLGEAEDMAEVISITETAISTPAADCTAGCVVTREFLPLEPDVEELKYYAPDIGTILAVDQESGETEQLIEVILP